MEAKRPNYSGKINWIEPEDIYFHTLPYEILNKISSDLVPKDKSSLSRVCAHFHALFQPNLDALALLRAVVDDKKVLVNRILDAKPELLLAKPRNLVIESQYTWQIFQAEPALKMALKRRQLDMVKLLLPYFDKVEKGREEALRQWQEVETATHIQNEHLDDLIKPLITVISTETFPNGSEKGRVIDRISEKTKEALAAFRKTILLDKAISSDDYLDVEQLLLAAHKVYEAEFNTFQTRDQRKLFCISVIGFLQSVQSPELAKVFCEGVYYVIEKKRQISARAKSLILQDNKTAYYRSSRDSLSGLGSDWLMDMYFSAGIPVRLDAWRASWENLSQAKTQELTKLKTLLSQSIVRDMESENKANTCCSEILFL